MRLFIIIYTVTDKSSTIFIRLTSDFIKHNRRHGFPALQHQQSIKPEIAARTTDSRSVRVRCDGTVPRDRCGCFFRTRAARQTTRHRTAGRLTIDTHPEIIAEIHGHDERRSMRLVIPRQKRISMAARPRRRCCLPAEICTYATALLTSAESSSGGNGHLRCGAFNVRGRRIAASLRRRHARALFALKSRQDGRWTDDR